ncbi:HAMP domain-containing protein [Sphaerisporangium album]|uniref:Oxygen sensor histidine kinase NreB n=1 Tax=Sphaerisporangium album TaxID=509200 RepID=A0A367F4Y2_9ACTN|nr:ATP-binding protein [Sphaerisporangium album]RCG25438.1 HAMP domain-containing protein [Sphaerisporangium album]
MWRFGLRTRTAASYVLVTAAAVLIVEAVLLGFVISSASGSDLFSRLQNQAGKDAKVLSATASKIYARLPDTGQRDLLILAMKASRGLTGLTGAADDLQLSSPEQKGSAPSVEVLADSQGRIVTSTAPESFHEDRLLVSEPPSEAEGRGGKGKTPTGMAAWWISPILAPTAYAPPSPGNRLAPAVDPLEPSKTPGVPTGGDPAAKGLGKGIGKGLQIIGYIYVQASDTQAKTSFGDSVLPLLAPGALVLALVVPVGVVFGMLSTGPLIRRITRLAEMTTAVARGDFAHRVKVSGRDEVSRLEEGFNLMTGQLGAAVEAERLSARADARQSERSRIARELHDSISQDLFSLSLLAAGMRRAAPDALRREAEAMEKTAARTMRDMQALLLELRPVALEDAGLVPALEELCRAYETRLGIGVRTSLAEVSLTPQAEHAVLRLTQEALGNAVKHGEPEAIEVRLWQDGREVGIRVADDGRGFDPSCPPLSHGMGLRLMRERVEELGGLFSLVSEPGEGTVVTASLPAAPDTGRPSRKGVRDAVETP